MDSRTMHHGKYLKSSDFEQPQLWTISDLQEEEIQNQQTGKPEHKWVIYFLESDERGIILNVTNRVALEEYLGFETDDWMNKQVVIFKGRTQFGTKTVDAIRMRQPRSAGPAAKVQTRTSTSYPPVSANQRLAPDTENPADGIDDDIPF